MDARVFHVILRDKLGAREAMNSTPKRKPGRPPKRPGEKSEHNLTFRTRGSLRAGLIRAAEKNGRSISEEIEHRLERSLDRDRMRGVYDDDPLVEAFITILRSTEEVGGGRWYEDIVVNGAVATAINRYIRSALPESPKGETSSRPALDRAFKSAEMADRVLGRTKGRPGEG
jgi:hypothetical protein